MTEERRRHGLSEEEIKAIAAELESRLVSRFYLNVGKGFWTLVWRGIMLALLALAVYGAAKWGIK